MDAVPRPPRPLAPVAAERLRLVAANAFGADGLDGASLNDILKRCGMGKGSFYHRFADKAALHDWVVRALADDMVDSLQPPDLRMLTAASFRPALTAMLGRATALAAERPELMNLGLMFHNSATAPADRAISGVRAAVLNWIGEALMTGRALGVVRSDLPADLLSAWAIASLTTIDEWVLNAPTASGHDETWSKAASGHDEAGPKVRPAGAEPTGAKPSGAEPQAEAAPPTNGDSKALATAPASGDSRAVAATLALDALWTLLAPTSSASASSRPSAAS